MKIGWLKFTMSMEIDYNSAQNGCGEERPMLFKNMLNRGHEVKLLSHLKKADIKEYENAVNGECTGIVDNDWMVGLQYSPNGFADGCDVLVIENGPLNMTFEDHFTNQPQIRRSMDVINKFEGLVIFYQTDPLLPFPFWRLTMAERPWSHSENNVRNKREAVEEDGWGDYDELFKNKRILIISKSMKGSPDFPETMNGDRFRYDHFYKEGLMDFDFLPTGYDNYFLPHIKRSYAAKLYPLIYIGYPRSRISSFKRFYTPFINKVHTFGPWNNDEIRSENLDKFREQGMKWYGYAKGFLEITEAYDEAFICVNLLPNKAQNLGWITNRLFESINCGCITLGDELTFGIDKFIPKELIVNESSVLELVPKILDMKQDEYEILMNKELDMVKQFNYDYVVSEFENLVKKYNCHKI
jgi:hypothetical protein